MTISCKIPSRNIPALKKAARELGVDFFVGELDGEYVSIDVIVLDYSLLISLGFIAGLDTAYNSMKNPMSEVQEILSKKIDKFKKDKNGDQLG